MKGGINVKDDNDITKGMDDESTLLKINSDGSDECTLIFKEDVSMETLVNALMTALYSVSIGLDGDDDAFALYVAAEYLSFVKRKTSQAKVSKSKKATLKLLSIILPRHFEQPTLQPSEVC